MMQNSNSFIVVLLPMWTAVYHPADLPRVIFRISRRAVDSELAAIATAKGAEQASPMPHLAPSPAPGFRERNCSLDLLVGMPGAIRHPCIHVSNDVLTNVNTGGVLRSLACLRTAAIN